MLPVIVSSYDAKPVIALFENTPSDRPQTYDLFASFIQRSGATLIEVAIVGFSKGVFYSKLLFMGLQGVFTMDSRVSDAFALALRCGAPIFVENSIIDELAEFKDGPDAGNTEAGRKREIEKLEKKLDQLIVTECYEDAAVVRDRIKALKLENGDG